MEFRNDIQFLRGVSVLFVVLYHLEVPGFSSGLLGVDIFFVISGYLMAILVDKGGAFEFYNRRLRRLAPAYFLTVCVTVVVAALITVPVDFNQVLNQSFYSVFFANNVGFWLQNSYFSKVDFNPLLNLWSLGVEVQFYLIAPFLLTFLKYRKALLGLTILASIVLCIFVVGISPKTAFFHLPFRIWEFLIGVSVAWYFSLVGTNTRFHTITGSVLLFLLCCVLLIPFIPNNPVAILGHPGASALTVCTITAAIIAVGLPNRYTQSTLGRWFVLLGKYSYSIYLVHFPVIVLFNYSVFNGTTLGFASFTDLGIILLITAVLSILLHHCVETQNKLIFKSILPYCLMLGLCCGVYASSLFNTSRFTDQQQLVFNAWTDRAVYRCGKLFRLLNPTKRYCKISPEIKNPTGRVLLVGNSHADAIKKSFVSEHSAKGIEVFFYVSNEPLRSNSVTVAHLVNDAIEIGASSVVLHYHNDGFDEKLVDRISALWKQLDDLNTPLIVLSPVPTYAYHIPKYLYFLSLGKEPYEPQSLDKHRQNNQYFWDAAHSSKWQGLKVFETASLLCPTGKCLREDEFGKPLYFDVGHLTLTGADYLKPLFIKLIDEVENK